MSSSPFSNPSKMPAAADSVETFGILKPRFISVSTGPKTTAWTVTPWLASSPLNDCVRFSAAAFEVAREIRQKSEAVMRQARVL